MSVPVGLLVAQQTELCIELNCSLTDQDHWNIVIEDNANFKQDLRATDNSKMLGFHRPRNPIIIDLLQRREGGILSYPRPTMNADKIISR